MICSFGVVEVANIKVEIIARDNSMISAKGLANLKEFLPIKNLLAVVGGISSPVALSQVDYIMMLQAIQLT